MRDRGLQLKDELHRLLLDEGAGVACTLVPRMLADPVSLTPEIRCCLQFLVRGIGLLAGRNGLLSGEGLLDLVVEGFEEARRRCERFDALWYSVVQEDETHWVQRYESTRVRYSVEELHWLHRQLGQLWEIERERLELERLPLAPLALRRRWQRALADSAVKRVSRSAP